MRRKHVTLTPDEAQIVVDMLKFIRKAFGIQETASLAQKINQYLADDRRQSQNETRTRKNTASAKRPKSLD